jgi:hypothetical protein
MKATSALTLHAGEIAALARDADESRAAALPSEAIPVLRGLLIGVVPLLLSALAGAVLASLTVGNPIGRLA